MGNIRVSVKLAIGFSIIIVMTVVVALLGINNQRQQVEGNKKLELANRMQEGTQSVRLLSFDSRLGMDTSLEEEARRLLENLNQNNDALHSLLYMPRSIELSGQFADASKRIYQAFENLTEAKKKNQSALNTALEYGADSDRLIGELINNLQAGSDSAMSLMEVSKKLASDTLELARKAGGEIDAIGNGISSIQAMGQQIATAAEEQSSVAEEINRSIVNVNGVAEQSASAMNQTAAAAVELAELSQHLHGLVGRFKV